VSENKRIVVIETPPSHPTSVGDVWIGKTQPSPEGLAAAYSDEVPPGFWERQLAWLRGRPAAVEANAVDPELPDLEPALSPEMVEKCAWKLAELFDKELMLLDEIRDRSDLSWSSRLVFVCALGHATSPLTRKRRIDILRSYAGNVGANGTNEAISSLAEIGDEDGEAALLELLAASTDTWHVARIREALGEIQFWR
jgi:hypothetical protein